MIQHSTRRFAWAATLSATLLVGCFGSTAQEDMAAAKAAIEKGDRSAAVIQLKNALQKNANMPDARYFLARMLYESGDIPAALIELEKASKLGYSETSVVPLRARLMVARGENAKVIEQFAGKNLDGTAELVDLLTTVSMAQGVMHQTDQAMQTVDKALRLDPSNRRAQLVRIRGLRVSAGPDVALRELDALLSRDAKDPEAWQVKGDILTILGKPDEAIGAYRQSISLRKKNIVAQAALVTLLLAKKDLDGAAAQLKELRSMAPRSVQAEFLGAALAYERNDLKDAKERIQRVLRITPDDARVNQLAANIDIGRGALIEADGHLGKVLVAEPGNDLARLLQVRLQLRLGNATKAEGLLQPLLEVSAPSAEVLALAAEIQVELGDTKAADDYLLKVAKLRPDDVRTLVARALLAVRDGKRERGVADLRAIAASNSDAQAEMALVNIYVQQGNYAQALGQVDAIDRKIPGRAATRALRGRIELHRGGFDKARQEFEAALKIDAQYYPALAQIVSLDVSANKLQDAQTRLRTFLQADPKHVPAQITLITLREKDGAKSEEWSNALRTLIAQVPSDVGPRLALIELQLKHKENKLALSAAQEAAAALPNAPEVWGALGQVQDAVGEFDQAIVSFGKQISIAPSSPGGYMGLVNLYLEKQDKVMAIKTLVRALGVKPDLLQAQALLVRLYLDKGNFVEARKVAQAVRQQRPTESAGSLMSGDIEVAQKQWTAAIAAYRAGLGVQPSAELAIKLHQTYVVAGEDRAAKNFESEWMGAHSGDVAFLMYTGDKAVLRRDLAEAEQRYQAVMKVQPDNARALNNIAWLTLQQKKTGALELALKANQLAPNQPPYMDTLAEIYASQGQVDKAVEVQKKALLLQPDSAAIRLTLARYYIDLGQKDAARQELTQLAGLSEKLPQQQEAKRLLAKL